jgi:hypothetical protein
MVNKFYDKKLNFKRNSSVGRLSQFKEVGIKNSDPIRILDNLTSSKEDIKSLLSVYPIGSREHDLVWETLLQLNHCISFLRYKLLITGCEGEIN